MKNKGFTFGGFIISVFAFIICAAGSFAAVSYAKLPETESVITSETTYYTKDGTVTDAINVGDAAVAFHFLELGNKYTGDCTFIKTDTCDILIDCGSKSNSIPVVKSYLDNYVKDGKLEYVIITHAHQDHYAGFATTEKTNSIFDLYECENVITFSKTNQKNTATVYNNYLRELGDEINAGATHLTATECLNRDFNVGTNVNMRILNSYYYTNESDTENDYSVCSLFTYTAENGKKLNALFTGDLEKEGEKKLIELNDLPEVDLYKAGHHGSKTSSSTELLSVIRPKAVCVCCCAGSPEYTKTAQNQFPTQQFIDNVSVYTDRVYVTTLCVDYKNDEFTSLNGNIAFLFAITGSTSVKCSHSDDILKNSEWFKANRTWNN